MRPRIGRYWQHDTEIWNRCDDCGRFIPMKDFASGAAERDMIYPDSVFTVETWLTRCAKCCAKIPSPSSPESPR